MRRVKTEWELSPSDRVPMLDIAASMVQTIGDRDSGKGVSEEEDLAYKSALSFLRREFDRGYIPTASHVVTSEDTAIEEADDEC